MDLRIFVEPQQGATYGQQLAMAQLAERLGFDAFFRSDHLLAIGGMPTQGPDGRPGPSDSWVTLGAIARETTTIRLGTMVTSATFRLPGPLAIAVAQVDEMSGGRVELGLGAGWYGDEHVAYGIPFPETKERFDRFEEQLQIISGLWRCPPDTQFSFEGDHYTIVGSPALPKPVQPGGPPIIVGGFGPKRTPRLAAAYAAEFNVPFAPPSMFRQMRNTVRSACEAQDRDPDDLVYSIAQVVCAGKDDEEVALRAGAIGRSAADLRENAIAGTPSEILDRIADYAEAGADRVYLQVLDFTDLDHVSLLGEQVLALLP
jgi:F420-dependent oxidoreductase-like protein